jgi:hypothetical protein
VFRRHYINSNWEEIKKMSKIREPSFHLMEHLLDKVAYPTSPICQVAGIGAEGYTEFMRGNRLPLSLLMQLFDV